MWGWLHSLYKRVRKPAPVPTAPAKRHWIAVSPFASLDLGFLSDDEALAKGPILGRVSFFDRENAVIIFDTHLVQSITEKV